jgi:hypothetical protein
LHPDEFEPVRSLANLQLALPTGLETDPGDIIAVEEQDRWPSRLCTQAEGRDPILGIEEERKGQPQLAMDLPGRSLFPGDDHQDLGLEGLKLRIPSG